MRRLLQRVTRHRRTRDFALATVQGLSVVGVCKLWSTPNWAALVLGLVTSVILFEIKDAVLLK